MPCETTQEHNKDAKHIQVSCTGDCDAVYKRDAQKNCVLVPVECILVTPVKYENGGYKPTGAKTECRCTIIDEDNSCRNGLTVKRVKGVITEVTCKNTCSTYFANDNCSVTAKTECKLVIDHTHGNIVRCVCIH